MPTAPVISRIETFRNPEYPLVVWVRIHSSVGFVGLGEITFAPDAVEANIHESIATYLLGKDPGQLDFHWDRLGNRFKTVRGRGVDSGSVSAIDMALWDLYARRMNQPLYQVLGGLSRDRIRVYNTCAGYAYGVKSGGARKAGQVDHRPEQPYEDHQAFMTDAGALADDLLSEGYSAMKIWPFDQFSNESNGQFISSAELEEGTEPFIRIREKVGNRMDVMVEMHSIWNLASAKRIAKSVKPTRPFWFEDPVPMNNIDALAEFRQSTHIATTASEQVATRWAFREMFEKQAMTICMFDVSWVGGISEAKRIAAMAHAYQMPIAPHDCVGPVTLMFSVHLSLNAPNALIQETVRAYNATWYREIVDRLPRIESGFAYPPEGAGAGTIRRRW
ncbi:MAG: mandelate racemase/muconate lactonizing enzyme family protein [Dehalococcoidia bacterium]|nr:mandelate racemase/muconate lactonizing enzyme family protein [Dehalococcoidia bacterium]